MYGNFSIKLLLDRINGDGSRFTLFNEIMDMDNKAIASIESKTCWLDLKTRKITAPPEKLFNIIKDLEKTQDFKISD